MNNWREAVRGAARIRDDVRFRGIVLIVVNTHDKGDILAFPRRGNDNLLCAGFDVSSGLARVGEQSGGLNYYLHPELLPGHYRGALLDCETFDLMPIDNQEVVFGRAGRFRAAHLPIEPT